MLTLLLALVLHAATAPKVDAGTLCISSFSAKEFLAEPMDKPKPKPNSVYTFRIGGRERARIGAGQTASITDLPTNKTLRLEVYLDGKHTETIRLKFSRSRSRSCLWFYPGYASWQLKDPQYCKCR